MGQGQEEGTWERGEPWVAPLHPNFKVHHPLAFLTEPGACTGKQLLYHLESPQLYALFPVTGCIVSPQTSPVEILTPS